MAYVQAPATTVVVQQTANPDQDFMVSCCATYCCACLGCIMYCIKPSIHTAWGILGGSGCSFFVAGCIITALGAMAGNCDRSDYQYSYGTYTASPSYVESSYKSCQDIVDAYRVRMFGIGITCIIVGLICFPVALWRHKVAKETAPMAMVVQQPMVVMAQPVYAQPPPMYAQQPPPGAKSLL
eukprot:PhF_6_TR40018/c0_g1_i2/m.59391